VLSVLPCAVLQVETAIRAWMMEPQERGPQHPETETETREAEAGGAGSSGIAPESPLFAQYHYGEWLAKHVPSNRSAPGSAQAGQRTGACSGRRPARPRTAGDWRPHHGRVHGRYTSCATHAQLKQTFLDEDGSCHFIAKSCHLTPIRAILTPLCATLTPIRAI